MRERLEARLTELTRELEVGERQLRDLELQQLQLRETVLRISGAVQVLRELLADGESAGRNGAEGRTAGSAIDRADMNVPIPATQAAPLSST